MYDKEIRKKNGELLKEMRLQSCTICGAKPCDPDHIKTRGAGGSDEYENMWPLCREHHTEKHKIGLTSFAKKYVWARKGLVERGWQFDCGRQKWFRPKGE